MKTPDAFVEAILSAADLPALKTALQAGLNRSFHVYLGQKRDATREAGLDRAAWMERRNAASWKWARRRRELQDAFAARLAELEGRRKA